jgi:hypothetical protein
MHWLSLASLSEGMTDLQCLVSSVSLSEGMTNLRLLRCNGKIPTTKDHYLLAFDANNTNAFSLVIWRNLVPRKCKFFLWLLHRQRLSLNAHLHHCVRKMAY